MNKKNITKMFCMVLLIISLYFLSFNYALAYPEGPQTIDVIESTRREPEPAETLNVIGGNVSQLNIFGTTQTRFWHGFYGNISGRLTLDNAGGHTFFDWNLSDPRGQIYASETTIDFSFGNIECYNFSRIGGDYLDLESYQTSLGMSDNSSDNINNTFNLGDSYPDFYVGINHISGICPFVNLYNATGQPSEDSFYQLLLYDLTANSVIFTSLIEHRGSMGFDGNYWDFQMLIAEDGSDGNIDPTTYYFYVELE